MKCIRILYVSLDDPRVKCGNLAEMFGIDLAGIDPETLVSVETALPSISFAGWKAIKQRNTPSEISILFEKEEEDE